MVIGPQRPIRRRDVPLPSLPFFWPFSAFHGDGQRSFGESTQAAHLLVSPLSLSLPHLSVLSLSLILVQARPLYNRRRWSIERRHEPIHWIHTAPIALDRAWRPPTRSDNGVCNKYGRGRDFRRCSAILRPF